MNLEFTRGNRVRRLGLTAVALLLTTTGIATVATAPAQAGEAGQDRVLLAAIYNDSPFDLKAVYGWSQWGWNKNLIDVPSEGESLFGMNGSQLTFYNNFCDKWSNTYNGWFTYKADLTGGLSEYVTFSIHGTRKTSTGLAGCAGEVQPSLDVWQTSTQPPTTWRYTDGAPPNVVAHPLFTYQHNVPYLFDQTIRWVGEGPGSGVPTIVSLGDSTISGEGGRWAGNTNVYNLRDDVGSNSYWDTPTGEAIPYCHRSKSAEVHIGGGVRSKNFACSGAETASTDWFYNPGGWRWKPGVDWECPVNGGVFPSCLETKQGQLQMLYHYAVHNNVKAVVVAVGANDFNFGGVLQKCMAIYFEQHAVDTSKRCYNDGIMQETVSDANRKTIEDKIFDSLKNLTTVMDYAGYDKSDYTVVLQNYWSPLPSDQEIRVADSGTDRANKCGLPIMNGDASRLNDYLLAKINESVFRVATRFRYEPYWPQLKLMDVTEALRGHRLCENGVGLIEDIPGGNAKGMDLSSAEKLEWVTQARTLSALDPGEAYTIAEGGHANYWGQLAERNCLRQMWNDILSANPSASLANGGKCLPAAGGVNSRGEPNMGLQPLQTPYRW